MSAISVIIPVYNVEKYLARCLDSILSQTFTDFEVICVNDGSQDGSRRILGEYAQKDTRICIIDQENQGQSVARNKGVERAQGEYILFVDSDDAIEKQLMEIGYGLIVSHQADIVTCGFRSSAGLDTPCALYDIQSLDCKVTDDIFSYYKSTTPYSVLNAPWSKLYRKSCIQDIAFPEGLYYQDAYHTWKAMLSRPKVVLVQEPLYIYTQNPVSTSIGNIRHKHITDYHKITLLIFDLLTKPQLEYELSIFLNRTMPSFLRIQAHRITECPIEKQLPFWITFEEQLRDLSAKGILPKNFSKFKKKYSAHHYILANDATSYYENKVLTWNKKPFYKKEMSTEKVYYCFGVKLFTKEMISQHCRAIHIFGMTFKYAIH